MLELTQVEARRIMLAAQGLAGPRPAEATKADVLAAIRRMAALQIDTISVVNRSPYFVLWSRIGRYEPRWLDELLTERQLFEYWAHAACFLPMEDYPTYRRLMIERSPHRGWREWIEARGALIEAVLARIRDEGPLRSADFEASTRPGAGWWSWKEEKTALEALFNSGRLMIAGRRNFQRVYDLRERVVPEWDDSQAPSREEADRALALKAVRAMGVARPRWAGLYFYNASRTLQAQLKPLADEGLIQQAAVEGIKGPVYVDASVREAPPPPAGATLLSPFDPIMWDRVKAAELFHFDYQIECYTPAPKRIYGYFTLPILWRDRLVGRLDPKAHRREGIFEVRNLHLEPGVERDDELVADLAAALRDCAEWHGTPSVVVRRANVKGLAGELTRALKGRERRQKA